MNKINRSKIISLLLIMICLVFTVYMISYAAVLPGLNESSDNVKEALIEKEERMKTYEGCFVDSTGDPITVSIEPGVPANCVFYQYGQLIGYNSTQYGLSGLRSRYRDYIFKGDSDNKGAQIMLTTNNKVQCAAYECIQNTDGCVVIIENNTGRLIALASTNSRAEINVNDLSNWEDLNSIEGFFIPTWKMAMAPGSVMKVVTSAAIIDHDMQNITYTDSGSETIDGYTFHNAGKAQYGNVQLEEALIHSINTYYAHMANQLGAFVQAENDERFMIGSQLDTDFDSIYSGHNLYESTIAEVAASGFGQGKLEVTPINVALIGQAISNDGVMLKPYVIDNISYGRKAEYKGKTETLSTCVSPETAETIRGYMSKAAISYGFPKEMGICAKTGTAEIGMSGLNRATLLSFNKNYTIVIVQNNTTIAGKKLVPKAVSLFNILSDLEASE